ncbi:MAG: 5-bromo-4-chloroindolyl phosphate hydrolysis family protein [Candidatus Azobacteroides sp.]|nr:5-bromo-4-chloroindolyl phosphate hydrolysis family protein [Candidatus Azobacteroides sp.]
MNRGCNIGKYTNRTATWELKNLWFLPLPFVSCGMLSFLPLFYMGIAGKKTIWTILGVIAASGVFTALVNISDRPDFGAALYIFDFIFSVFFSFYFCKEFLQRLDLISKGYTLNKTKKYDYYNYDPSREKISRNTGRETEKQTNNIGLDFILELNRLKKTIKSEAINRDIQKMISVSEIILQKDKTTSDVFFERNAGTVNKILDKYRELESLNVGTAEMNGNLLKMEEVIEKITTAFEQEVSNIYKGDLLDINAEADAFLQSLKNRGLLENN